MCHDYCFVDSIQAVSKVCHLLGLNLQTQEVSGFLWLWKENGPSGAFEVMDILIVHDCLQAWRLVDVLCLQCGHALCGTTDGG